MPAGAGTTDVVGAFLCSPTTFFLVHAIPTSGHKFVSFVENGVVISTSPALIVYVYANRTITINFAPIGGQ